MTEHTTPVIPADVWQTYRAELVRFVTHRVRDPHTAEDVVQDVLLRAYSQRHRLRDATKLRSWLYQIARNAIIDFGRTHRSTEELPDTLPVEPPMLNDATAEAELAQCLRPLVDLLPERYREAVALAELEGHTQRDVADALNLSVSGAKSRVQRGRKLLAERLIACCSIAFDTRGRVMDYDASSCVTCASPAC